MSEPNALTDLTRLSLAAARDGLKAKDFTSLELTDAYLKAIDAANSKLNAYVAVTAEQAQARAKASDAKLASGQGGPLEGIPELLNRSLAVKITRLFRF